VYYFKEIDCNICLFISFEAQFHFKNDAKKCIQCTFQVTCSSCSAGGNINRASKKFGIDRKCVRLWNRNKEELLKVPFKRFRSYKNNKRPAAYPDLENDLQRYIEEIRTRGGCVSGVMVRAKARQLAYDQGKFDFSGSSGWFRNFLNRKKYSLRRLTSKGRDLPTNCKEIINTFIEKCHNAYGSYDRSCVYNMDETSIQLHSPHNTTYVEQAQDVF
jgi:hypothetical protein